MKLNKLLFLAPVAFLSLTSCGKINQRIPIEKYILDYTDAHDAKPIKDENWDFNILQLSDIHLSVLDDSEKHFKFIQKTIDEAEEITKDSGGLHLIVITGDVFTFADKGTVKDLTNFFEKQKIPWTLTFGNHDEQGYFPIDWMTNYLTSVSKRDDSNLLFVDFPNDDVFGNANFIIDIPEESQSHRQIVMLDSNRYNYGEGFGYDYIHQDQIDWYLRAYSYLRDKYPDPSHIISSLAFFHIPLPEYIDAYEDALKDNSKFLSGGKYVFKDNKWGEREETLRDQHYDKGDAPPKVNTNFYDAVQQLGYTKGLFVGHLHKNNNCMDYMRDGDTNSVALCYGVKATDRVYCSQDMLGGQLIHYHRTVNPTKASDWFDLDLIYHTYNDLEGK